MRLTLRTMLAYLDDILEPADREEIGRKIEESDFAKQLVNRIRESTHKLRLGAPKLSGKGMGLDPNTVAEYLDNTLAGERVPDLEKVCLESDTQLAEVAASHQILTLVLGQPVEVDPEMKRRMYGLVRGPEAPKPIEPVGGPMGERFSGEDEGIIPNRQRVEVPAYLRDRPSHSPWRTIVAAIVLILVLCGAITMALGPPDRTNLVARWLGFGQPENKVAQNNAGETPPAAGAPSQPDKTAPPAPESTTEKSPSAGGSTASATPPASDTSSTTASTQETTLKQPTETTPTTASDNTGAIPPSPTATPPGPEPGDSVSSMPTETAVTTPVPTDPGKSSLLPPQTEPTGGSAAAPAPQAADVLLGRLLPGKGVVLLKLDATSGLWNRLVAGSPLNASDKLLVLPTFRPTLALTSGITLQVPSESMIELEAPDASGVPGVRVHFGRLVVMTTGQSGAKLRLDLGPASGTVLFTDSEATLGVEVRRYHPAGADPEAQDAQTAADLYAVSGRIQWTPSDGSPTTLTAPERAVVSAHPSDPANADAAKQPIPKWIASEQLNPLNALAADDLVRIISDEKKPLNLELREMAEHRRIEWRSLAAQCLALLDEFEPLITALGDPDEHPVWPVQITSVRSALARGPSTAAKVRTAFQKQRGEEDGRELYRMLWGYTKDQLQSGESAKLVAFLNNDNLDFRVLAFANLQDICKLTFSYRPDAPVAARESPLKRWQDQQNKGLIVPK